MVQHEASDAQPENAHGEIHIFVSSNGALKLKTSGLTKSDMMWILDSVRLEIAKGE